VIAKEAKAFWLPGCLKDEDINVDKQLLDFLDFMYNDVFIDVQVFDDINQYIHTHYGVPAAGGTLSTYRKWYTDEIGDGDE